MITTVKEIQLYCLIKDLRLGNDFCTRANNFVTFKALGRLHGIPIIGVFNVCKIV